MDGAQWRRCEMEKKEDDIDDGGYIDGWETWQHKKTHEDA
jgi:hypothetical protein